LVECLGLTAKEHDKHDDKRRVKHRLVSPTD